jgi:hypothetical protein
MTAALVELPIEHIGDGALPGGRKPREPHNDSTVPHELLAFLLGDVMLVPSDVGRAYFGHLAFLLRDSPGATTVVL